ncbi:EAL domain-containing protein [Eubacteriaceae bacterium ES3]|nr:EAL domain-containing protein [Eubacteriaceae bacterium ES3]
MNQPQCRTETIQLEKMLNNDCLRAFFQPIMSVTGKKILGIEGLIRGFDPLKETLISPLYLFSAAHTQEILIDLDRACRESILSAFVSYHEIDPDLLLFLNIDTAIIDSVSGSDFLDEQVNRYGICPQNIVIEINESKSKDIASLNRFVKIYKSRGYLIALDDVGAGFSNMDRIAEIKPDIIKIDRSIIMSIDEIYHKQEIFKSLVNLSNKIGALIVAEGVETRGEAISVLKLGAQVIQGFYFAKPSEYFTLKAELITKAAEALEDFKAALMDELVIYNEKRLFYTRTVNSLVKALIVADSQKAFDGLLIKALAGIDAIDCAYVLDQEGIQCSETINAKKGYVGEKRVFHSANTGVDHSIKKFYFNLIKHRQDTYISEPYVSMATGHLCITYSRVFNLTNGKYVLCVDFLDGIEVDERKE